MSVAALATVTTAITATTVLAQFETATLTEFNRRLSEEQHQTEYNFRTYDELKDIHDNEGGTRVYLTGIAKHVIMEYVDDCSDEQIDDIIAELGISTSDEKQRKLIEVRCALMDKYICSPSPKQLKMMQMD